MKKSIIISILVVLSAICYGQGHVDALKFSQTFPNGTARNIGMGGAFGSLGGDFSALSINPAGLGVYRSSEFVFSAGYNTSITQSSFLNNKARKPDELYSLNNIGFVGVINTGEDAGWISTGIAMGYNRTNNFFFSADIEGIDHTSMANYFYDNTLDGNGDIIHPDDLHPYYERLAFDAYVIDTATFVDDLGPYWDYFPNVPNNKIGKRNSTTMKGRNGEFLFNFAANYNNVFYIGGAFTINSIVYDYSNLHREEDYNNDPYFEYFDYYFENKTTGRGVSFKLGAIVKPVSFFRIGGAIHLPTYYSLTDQFNANMSSNYTGGSVVYPTDFGGNRLGKRTYEYKLTTPSKFVLSVGCQLRKFGLVSVDLERVNYENMRFDEGGDGYDFYNENKDIMNIYRNTSNIRAGAEFRLGSISVRGGLNFYPSPFESDELNKNADYFAGSLGIGYKQNNFYIDFGMQRQFHEEYYIMFNNGIEDYGHPKISFRNTQFISTMGFRFN